VAECVQPDALEIWEDSPPQRWSLHGQTTVVPQGHVRFHSPYSGTLSLTPAAQLATSWTATLFAGVRAWPGGSFFVNPEISAGTGLGATHGVAAFPNGEIYRVAKPAPRFNWSRLFVQHTLRLGPGDENLPSAPNQLAASVPLRRLTVVAGKFSLNDYFDKNSYSHDPRSQFLNWGLMDTGAYDYAADTRGYTWGVYSEANLASWALRLAAVMLPRTANGAQFDDALRSAGSINIEGEWRYAVLGRPGILRGLVYDNRARMGSYAAAVAQAGNTIPRIADTRAYHSKWGGGLSWEQAVWGDSGVFARLGLADGRYESWAFTEIERSLALGGQLDGTLWGRANDRIGVALLLDAVSADHARYLQAGGLGFILGDGNLRYSIEGVVEAYYAWKPYSWLSLTADWQAVWSPGYNRDRGPVQIAALRLHLET
jgi:high affinity Mn2+ porin